MSPEDKMRMIKIVEEFDNSIKEMQKSISQILNGVDPPENFQKIFEEWKEKRQLINNLGMGVLTFFSKIKIVTFPLKGDLEKDLGQKKSEETTSLTPEQIREFDNKFFDSMHISRDENLEQL